ncbi:MAG: amino acid decarboxylase [Bacteroidetes bacterium]|nr:amino acid decarboxylase [Bacteroidota bacterium]
MPSHFIGERTVSAHQTSTTEETLDPHDWEEIRALGRQMLDDMIEYLRTVRERPVWQPLPQDLHRHFERPLPRTPRPLGDVYAEFKEKVLPYPTGNIHPRFWGWVMGNGTITGMLAEMLAAGFNPNQGGLVQSGNLVESQVISWCKEMFGFPPSASGLLVSGGSMANLVALTVARNNRAGYNVREEGVGSAPRPLRIYASTEVHSSVHKAVEILGLGCKGLRLVGVNQDLTMNLDLLKSAIREDREKGLLPICVVGCAGTVNTGATDALDALADLCKEEGLWFHVDGAFGALAALSPELRHLVKGMERADSLAFDMHKWMYMPYEVGCTLLRDADVHRQAFSLTPHYLERTTRGIAGTELWFSDYGVQLSRGFRALKVWMSIQENGIDKFGRLIRQNVEQARYLERLVTSARELELVAAVPLNIVCFRYVGSLTDAGAIDTLNKELLLRLHESGIAAPSNTVIQGKYALRVCITNHRSTKEDLALLVQEVLRIGKTLTT